MFKYYKNIISCILKNNFAGELESQSEKLIIPELSNDPIINKKLSEIKLIIDSLGSAEIKKDIKEKIGKIWLGDDYSKIGEKNPGLADKLVLALANTIGVNADNMKEIRTEASSLLEGLRQKLYKATSIIEIEDLTNSEIDKLNLLSGINNDKVSLKQFDEEVTAEIITQTSDIPIKIIDPETTEERKGVTILETLKDLGIAIPENGVKPTETKTSGTGGEQEQVEKSVPEVNREKSVKPSFKENVPWVKKYLEKDFSDVANPKIDEIVKVLEESKNIKFNGKKGPEKGTSAIFSIQSALQLIGNNITVDGMYGIETKNVILEFQKKYNEGKDKKEQIKVDGIPGKQTINALLSSLNS